MDHHHYSLRAFKFHTSTRRYTQSEQFIQDCSILHEYAFSRDKITTSKIRLKKLQIQQAQVLSRVIIIKEKPSIFFQA